MNSPRNSTGEAASDAISLLTADHRKIRRLFQEFEDLQDKTDQNELKADLIEQICFDLSVHALVEEEIFYPAVRAAIDDDDLMDEAEAEHAQAKDLIGRLEAMTPDERRFDAAAIELFEQVEHHMGEEEDEMFVKAKSAKIDLDTLGQQIKERKEQIEADFNPAPAPGKAARKSSRQARPAQGE